MIKLFMFMRTELPCFACEGVPPFESFQSKQAENHCIPLVFLTCITFLIILHWMVRNTLLLL